MTKFKTSLLTAAVVTALALPGLASAASFKYNAPQQITFAKDLIVNNNISIETPSGLELAATIVDNQTANITNIAAFEVLTVKVTLDNAAEFDTTANAETLVKTFLEGTQTGGGPVALGAAVGVPGVTAGYIPGTANYNGSELNFKYVTSGAGNVLAGFFLQMNSFKVKNLVQALYTANQFSAEVTVQNGGGQQILAARVVAAKSKWGVTVESDTSLGDVNKTIDVASQPNRKSRFAPTGIVGESLGSPAGFDYFNAGAVVIDIAKALETSGGATTYINNFNATALLPEYNIVNTAKFTMNVSGIQLSPFLGQAWLDTNPTCAHAAATSIDAGPALVGGVGGSLQFKANATNPIFNGLTAAPPAGPVLLYVCLADDGTEEMNAQALTGELFLDYVLPTQRVNPPSYKFDLLPLVLNGSTIIFQNVNPAGNMEAQSFLRITNNTSQICPMVIDAKDDEGFHSKDIMLTLAPHKSIQLNSEMLEGTAPKAGVTGGFTDGTGKWYVRITAECAGLKASALNRHIDGVVTDLTPEKGLDTWLTPPTSL